jgi:hypothetical protein
MERYFDFRIDMKTARRLMSAMHKGVFMKLTKAEASALEDLITELLMQVE